jgi:hypothetical protein
MKYLSLVVVLLMAGCQFGRDTAYKLSVEDLKNMETAREVSANCVKGWPTKEGLIKGLLEGRMDELPENTIKTMEILHDLSVKDPNDMTDYDLGYFLGLKLQLTGPIAEGLWNKYASDVLKTIMQIL